MDSKWLPMWMKHSFTAPRAGLTPSRGQLWVDTYTSTSCRIRRRSCLVRPALQEIALQGLLLVSIRECRVGASEWAVVSSGPTLSGFVGLIAVCYSIVLLAHCVPLRRER